jgi:hypothetical protein
MKQPKILFGGKVYDVRMVSWLEGKIINVTFKTSADSVETVFHDEINLNEVLIWEETT